MKKLILLLSLFIMFGCGKNRTNTTNPYNYNNAFTSSGYNSSYYTQAQNNPYYNMYTNNYGYYPYCGTMGYYNNSYMMYLDPMYGYTNPIYLNSYNNNFSYYGFYNTTPWTYGCVFSPYNYYSNIGSLAAGLLTYSLFFLH